MGATCCCDLLNVFLKFNEPSRIHPRQVAGIVKADRAVKSSTLKPGDTLEAGATLTSASGVAELTNQHDVCPSGIARLSLRCPRHVRVASGVAEPAATIAGQHSHVPDAAEAPRDLEHRQWRPGWAGRMRPGRLCVPARADGGGRAPGRGGERHVGLVTARRGRNPVGDGARPPSSQWHYSRVLFRFFVREMSCCVAAL